MTQEHINAALCTCCVNDILSIRPKLQDFVGFSPRELWNMNRKLNFCIPTSQSESVCLTWCIKVCTSSCKRLSYPRQKSNTASLKQGKGNTETIATRARSNLTYLTTLVYNVSPLLGSDVHSVKISLGEYNYYERYNQMMISPRVKTLAIAP